ncbi:MULTISPECIES: hypothetical protein [Luteimonas]|uniref:hypothetical protein n=1 Tax=Luteimonas TaxID=83614 RepID=UPI0011803348|nr:MULTISPECIES: hypothetical protein [Luteimonas]
MPIHCHAPARVPALALLLALAGCATVPVPAPAPAPVASTLDRDPTLRASAPRAPVLASPVVVPLDPDTRARLSREPVQATVRGATLDCAGTSLFALLRASGVVPGAPLAGAHLTRYVLVTGRDGDRVVFSLGELDPTLGHRRVYLVDRCEGGPSDAAAGAPRLVVADDSRAARGVSQVVAITVIVAP